MPNVTLKNDSKILFGNRLPTIFIDKVEVYAPSRAAFLGIIYDAAETYVTQTQTAAGYEALIDMYDAAGVDLPPSDFETGEEYAEYIQGKIASGASESHDIYHGHYSCYITFDKEKTQEEISNILKTTDLANLKLYTILNVYHGFNLLVAQNKLPLYDVFKANNTPAFLKSVEENLPPGVPSSDAFAIVVDAISESPAMAGQFAPQIQITEIKNALSQNIKIESPRNELEEWGFIIEDYRDNEGNLVIRIPFKNSFANAMGLRTAPNSSVALLATCGTEEFEGEEIVAREDYGKQWMTTAMGGSFDTAYDTYGSILMMSPFDRSQWRTMFNSYFGDITYQMIYEDGAIINPHEDVFIYAADRELYADTPIQALNGEYYAHSDGTTQKKLGEILTTLITQYEEFSDPEFGDPQLGANVSRLELIMGRHGESTSVLYALQEYLRRYPEKSSIVLAGKFYGELKKILFNFNKQVRREKRVQKVLTLNPVVSDMHKIVSDEYDPPMDLADTDPNCAINLDYKAGGEGHETHTFDPEGSFIDSMYIPEEWHMMSRNTKITIPWGGTVSDYMEYIAEEGIGGWEILTMGDDTVFDDFGRSGDFWGGTDGQDYWKKGNTIVQNKGYWFLDYEKALHALSRIAKVFDVSKLTKYLNYKIPYEYFKIKAVYQSRREFTFTVNNETTWGGDEDGVMTPLTVRLKSTFNTDVNYPISESWEVNGYPDHPEMIMPVVYAMDADIDGTTSLSDSDASGIDSYGIADTLKHQSDLWGESISEGWAAIATIAGSEYTKIVPNPDSEANLQHADKAYIKFMNIDFPTTIEGDRLSAYNGEYVRNGYRLAAFEYVDFMDDDIAFYNTFGLDMLNEFSADDSNDVVSRYYMLAQIEDSTTKVYVDIYNFCERVYASFMKYYEIMNQPGNVDIETGRPTRMFKEGIAELYPTPELQPWTRAAYVYEAMRQVLYNIYPEGPTHLPRVDSTQNRELIFQAAAQWETKIGPDVGTLFQAGQFRHLFLVLLNKMLPQSDLAQTSGDDETGYMAHALNTGIIDTGEVFGDNPVYDKMMSIIYPDLAWDDPGMHGDAEGMLFSQLENETVEVRLRGQKPITEAIYGNLLTSAMGQGDYTSSAMTPMGSRELEDNEVRLRVMNIGTPGADGTPKIVFFIAGLANLALGDTDETWALASDFGYIHHWWNGDQFPASRGNLMAQYRRESAESYPIFHAGEEYAPALYGPSDSWDADDGADAALLSAGLIIDLEKWSERYEEMAADGILMDVTLQMKMVTHFPASDSNYHSYGSARIPWPVFLNIFGRNLDLTREGEASAASRPTGYTAAGGAALMGDSPTTGNPDYIYPTTGNQLLIWAKPFSDETGTWVSGAAAASNIMAIGPLFTERLASDTSRAGYD